MSLKNIFSANKTSARLLLDYSRKKLEEEAANPPQAEIICLMVLDLYIKARSYAAINKIAFVFALLAGIMVIMWPSIAIVANEFGFRDRFLESAVIQTTITGLAALLFAVYSHYKKRQMQVENLMRTVVYTKDDIGQLIQHIQKEMERIDLGFRFSDNSLIPLKPDEILKD